MLDKLKDIENKVDNSYLRQTYSQNDISRYERNLEDAERNQETLARRRKRMGSDWRTPLKGVYIGVMTVVKHS